MMAPPIASSSSRSIPCSEPSAPPPRTAPQQNGPAAAVSPKKAPFEITLTPSGHDQIGRLLNEQRILMLMDKIVSWTLGHFLQKFCEYFQRSFKGKEIEWTSGVFPLLGKDFWRSCLRKFRAESLEDLADPRCWSFCTEHPAHYDIHFCLPATTVHQEEFNLLCSFCAYLIVIENTSRPLCNQEAVMEFSQIIKRRSVPSSDDLTNQRWEVTAKSMGEVEQLIGRNPSPMTIEIPLAKDTKLRLFFSHLSPEKPEPFSLKLLSDTKLSSQLVCRTTSMKAAAEIIGKLSLSKERRLAYQLSAFHMWGDTYHFLPEINESDIKELTPLGHFIYVNVPSLLSYAKEASAVLTIAGLLRAYLVPQGRSPAAERVSGELRITWRAASTRLHLVLPDEPEAALDQLYKWMKKDPNTCLACLGHGLAVFFPTFHFGTSEAPWTGLQGPARQQASEIYQALKAEKRFPYADLLWFSGLLAAGWSAITEEDLLDLPSRLSPYIKREHLNGVLDGLKVVYCKTPYESLFSAIQNRLASINPLNPEAVHSACLQELMVSREPKVAPAAWALWSKSDLETDACLTFMIEICPRLGLDSIPFAVPHVQALCAPEKKVKRQDRLQLVTLLLDQLLGLSSNGHERTVYAPILGQMVADLVEKRSKLRSDLPPRIQSYLFPPAAAAASSEPQVDEVPEPEVDEAPAVEDESDRVWTELQLEREKHNGSKEFPKVIEIFERHFSTLGSRLVTKRGFYSFVKWVAEVLE
ncbi:MAG TPA: hypothetical protein VMR37_03655, partial [Rhabdochlamydiaceae bacterium]|nr:hypothetical protein [Rhabdochlamydiaceae bacterium]